MEVLSAWNTTTLHFCMQFSIGQYGHFFSEKIVMLHIKMQLIDQSILFWGQSALKVELSWC